jgi:hypothetical protein
MVSFFYNKHLLYKISSKKLLYGISYPRVHGQEHPELGSSRYEKSYKNGLLLRIRNLLMIASLGC